jgi:hypothetical protein
VFKALKIMNTKVFKQVIIGNTGYSEILNDANDPEEMLHNTEDMVV